MATSMSVSDHRGTERDGRRGSTKKGEDGVVVEKNEEQTPTWSTIVPDTATNNRGDIRRPWNPSYDPAQSVAGCRTLYEAFRRGAAVNPLGPCLGFRAVSSTGFATPFVFSSYTECLQRCNALAAGLDALNLLPPNESNDKNDSDNDDGDGMRILGLYVKNCMEWVIAEQGAYCLGGLTAPCYDTLGPDTLRFVLKRTGMKTVVCAREQLDRLCQVKADCPHFTTAVVVDGVTAAAAEMAAAANVTVVSFAKVEAVGAQKIAETAGGYHKHTPPAAADVCTLLFTSGTTGDPKGALLTHENVLAHMAGAVAVTEIDLLPSDRHLSYLPLAHIFERLILYQTLLGGGCVGFYRGDPTFLFDDLCALRPTIFAAVPRVLNKVYDKINAGVAAAGGMKKKLFDAALASKRHGLLSGHVSHALYDRLVFGKIKRGLGLDQVRIMISGAAPLSADVMTFFRCLLSIPVVEGYGQTEGAGAACIGHPADTGTAGHVGGPTGAAEICLQDVPEMGYYHTDRTHRNVTACCGRGEILVRGRNVFKGYYRDPVRTAECVTADGWLQSGDIGLWRPDGALQIIDRKKNIFKLAQGEYVAPEKIENVLQQSPLVAQAFVYGDSLQTSLVAILVPDEDVVMQQQQQQQSSWTKEDGGEDDDSKPSFVQLCTTRSRALRAAVQREIDIRSRDAGLHGFETVKAFYLEPDPFTIDNGLLTPTMKLKRMQARDKYRDKIDDLYRQLASRSRL